MEIYVFNVYIPVKINYANQDIRYRLFFNIVFVFLFFIFLNIQYTNYTDT